MFLVICVGKYLQVTGCENTQTKQAWLTLNYILAGCWLPLFFQQVGEHAVRKIRLNLAYGLIYELDPDFFLLNNRTCRKWKIKMILCMLFFVQLYWSDCQGIMWEKVGQTRYYHLKNKSKSRSFLFFKVYTAVLKNEGF